MKVSSLSRPLLIWLAAVAAHVPFAGAQQAADTPPAPAQSASHDAAQPAGKPPAPPPARLPDQPLLLDRLAQTAFEAKDYKEFVRIRRHHLNLRPFDQEVMIQLVVGNALLDDKPQAYTTMLNMQQQGLGVDFDAIPEVENIRGTEVYSHINVLLKGALEPYNNGAEVAFTLPENLLMPEAIVWDPRHEQFIVGTVREGKIVRLGRDGKPAAQPPPFAYDGRWSVLGLAVDAERRILWASTSALGQHVGYKNSDFGQSALLAFDLDSGQARGEYRLAPDGNRHGLANLALAADGTVYVADLRQPVVHVLKAGADQLTMLAGSGQLTNIRGLAVDDERGLLYIADREMGFAFWSDAEQRLFRPGLADNINLGGIEGLSRYPGGLLIVQNGIEPERVMALRLDDSGKAVRTALPLAAALPEFRGPTFGTLADDGGFYFLAANHWSAYDIDGRRRPGTALDPVPVMKIDLAAAGALEPLSTAVR